MTIEEYFGDWVHIIDLKEADHILGRLKNSKEPVCPCLKDVFKAFRLCPLSQLRVVILGQDPYSNSLKGKPVATGLAFANNPSTPETTYSPSLEVLKESVIDYSIPHNRVNFDPSLESWEAQGVLLLNTALSCIQGKPGSHALLWQPFITSLLTKLSQHTTAVVYVLMGSSAQALEPYIAQNNNHIIRCKHPAWYARQHETMPSSIWRQVNSILIGLNDYGIEWYKSNE